MHTRALAITLVLLLGAGLLVSAAACGGGGGGGGGAAAGLDDSALTGTYFWVGMLATDDFPAIDEAICEWGTASADGAGSMTVNATANENGFINPPYTNTVPYTVAPDGTWVWQLTGMDFIRGGVSADGRIAGGAAVLASAPAAINLLLRREGTWDVGSLNGTYHMCSLRLDPALGNLQSWWGTAAFDAAGNVTFSHSENTEGAVLGPGLGGATTYSVLADGTTTISAPPTLPFQGGIGLGGDVVMLSGSTAAGQWPGMIILVRQSSSASAATVLGGYHLAGLSRNGGGGFTSFTGPATSDGAGNVTVTLTRNEDGSITTDPTETVPYTVMPDGTFIVTPGGGESFIGATTPDGRFGMLAGETTGVSDPQLIFMFR